VVAFAYSDRYVAYLAYRYRLLDFGGPRPYLNILYRRRKKSKIDVLAFVRLASWTRIYRWWNNRDMEQWSFSLFLSLDSVLTFRRMRVQAARLPMNISYHWSESERLKVPVYAQTCWWFANMIWFRLILQVFLSIKFHTDCRPLWRNCNKPWTYSDRSDFQQVDVSDKEVYKIKYITAN